MLRTQWVCTWLAGALAIAWILTSTSDAATWDGGGGDGNWTTPANWVGDIAPSANDVLQFDGTTNLVTSNNFAGNTQFNGINFLAGAGAFTLGGNPVLIGWDGITPSTINQDSANAQLINFGTPGVPGTAGLIVDGATVNVGGTGSGTLTINQVTFGLAALGTTASTMNVNRNLTINGFTVQTKNTSPTANVINVAGGSTLTLTGPVRVGSPTTTGQGNLVTLLNIGGAGNINATTANNSNFIVGVGNDNNGGQAQATLDMSTLTGNFTYSTGATGTGNFFVGRATRPAATLRLGSGTNTITADQFEVGDSTNTPGYTNSGNNAGGNNRLFLGASTNIINADTINVGVVKAQGNVDWQTGTGSVTIRAQDGVARVGTTTVGNFSSGSATNAASKVVLAGHNADVLANTVIVGRLQATGSPTAANEITFDRGTFDVNSLQLGVNVSGVSNNGIFGQFTLGTLGDVNATGVLNVNTQFILGNDSANTTFTPTGGSLTNVPTKAAFIVNSGTANVFTDIVVNRNNTVGAIDLDESTLTLAGGTLDMHGKNIGSYASPVKTINLNGGTLANAAVIAGRSINVGATTLSGSPVYLIADAGTLSAPSGLTLPSGTQLQGGGATGAGQISGDITASSGSTINPGVTGVPATLQFNNSLTLNGGSTLHYDLSNNASSGNDQVTVAGSLNLSGTVNLDYGALGSGAQIGNTYILINYTGSLTGDETNFSSTSGGTRMTFTVQPTSSTPGSVQVAVGGTGAFALTWIGNANNNWNLIGDSNWQDPSLAPQQFYNLDTVTFDDTSTNLNDVQIVGSVQPGSVTVNATRNYTFAGTGGIVGSSGLTKSGSGALVLATNNTYSGTTDIQVGTIQVGNGGTSGSLGSGAVTDNGALVFNRSDNVTVANTISGSGTVTKAGTGVLTLSGSNTYSGATTVSTGTLKATSGASTGDTNGADLTVASGATFDIGGNTTANNFNLGAKTVHISGNGVGGTAGALANSGGAAQNAAFNRITLDADALIAGARMDIGRTNVGTRTLDLANHTLTVNMTGAQPIFSVLDAVSVTAGNMVATAGGFNFERSSSTPNSGGTITLNTGTVLQVFQTTSGALSRDIVLKGGNVVGSGSTTAGIISSNMQLQGNITIEALASGAPTLTANNPLTIEGVMSESGGARSVTKLGVSAATLTGTNTYSGGTTVGGGSLIANGATATLGTGNVTVNGVLNAFVSITNGSTAISDTATLFLGGCNGTCGTDGVANGGYASLGSGVNETVAALMLSTDNGANYSPAANGTWGATGSGAAHISDEYFAGTGILTVGAATLPGDFNGDTFVNAADYVTLRKQNPDTSTGQGLTDYVAWRENFQPSPVAGPSLAQESAVPEPGAILLAWCAMFAVVFLRSRGVR